MAELTKPIAYEERENPELEQDFVFISYCHGDKDVVYSDLIRMNKEGARFWYDENVFVGDNWLDRVTNVINSPHCRGVLFYLSPNSFYSQPMLTEVKLAQERLQSQLETGVSFKIASINIGRKPVLETLRTLNVSDDLFRGFLFAFDEKVHFIARYFDPKSDDHLGEMLSFFADRNSLPDEFLVSDYYDGVQILKYNGSNPNVVIPSTINNKKVNSIGIHAFENNSTIKYVHISEGLTLIDDFAFYNCSNLETIVLPNSLKIIGYEAFCKCTHLNKIIFPYNVQKIGSHAFYKCSQLSTVVFNSIVPLTIKFAAFEECESLTTLIFPTTLEIIEPYTFSNCVSLKYVVIPDSVKNIGYSAFHSCSSLKEVHFKPDNAPDNNNIFSRCLSLSSITIDEEDKDAYLRNKTWSEYKHHFRFKLKTPTNIIYNNNTIYWEGSNLATNYIIKIDGKEAGVTTDCVYEIPYSGSADEIKIMIKAVSNDRSCINSDYSKELIIDKNAFKIISEHGELVLKEYTGFEENIIVPSVVTVIDEKAFYNNIRLKSIILPEGLKSIKSEAFYRCRNLETITFPNTLEEIGDYAFWGTNITGKLLLPKNLRKLGIRAFSCCNNISSVTIPSPLTKSERGVFYRCLGLKKVNLPKNYAELYRNMFKGCFELTSITLPSGLIKIDTGSLSSLMKLEDVTIPANVTEIEPNSFGSSLALKNIYVEEGNEVFFDYDGILINKLEKKLCQFPPNHHVIDFSKLKEIEKIGEYGFSDNALIEELVLPDSVRRIEAHAFERCTSLKKIKIGRNIEFIGENAFHRCHNLETIILDTPNVPLISADSLQNLPGHARIYVHEEDYDSYIRDINWHKLSTKILKIETSDLDNWR